MRCLILCFLFVAVAADARVYSWVDADGKRHFSDQPPPDTALEVEEKVFELHNIDRGYPAGIIVPPASTGSGVLDRAAAQAERRLAAACQQARKDLELLSGRVIFRENGEEVYVSERRRAEIVAELRGQIETRCD